MHIVTCVVVLYIQGFKDNVFMYRYTIKYAFVNSTFGEKWLCVQMKIMLL